MTEQTELTSTSSIEAYITVTAHNQGVSPAIARHIAFCESRYIYNAKNPTSTASGVFQFIHLTWISTMTRMGRATTTSPFNARENIEAGIFLLKNDSSHHWDESAYCWNPERDD